VEPDQSIDFRVSAAPMRFMMLQRGDLAHLRADPDLWLAAMKSSVRVDFAQMQSVEPAPNGMLDIGSGIGSVDMLYAKLMGTHVALIDGEQDDAVMIRQDQTFCSSFAVREFFRDNDINMDQLVYMPPTNLIPLPRDFIISMRSWCFHYPPDFYLNYVMQCISPGGAKLVIDVRRDRPLWREQLRAVFKEVDVIESRSDRKFDRVYFEHPGV